MDFPKWGIGAIVDDDPNRPWVKKYPGVGTVLVGPRRVEHFSPIHDANHLNLLRSEIEKVALLMIS